MDWNEIEKALRKESKTRLVDYLTIVVRLCIYDQERRDEYEAGWVDSRIALLDLAGLGHFLKEEA